MKKLLAIISCSILLCSKLHAQKNIYLEPTLGVGTSNVVQSYIQTPYSNTGYNRSNKVNYSMGLLAGYQLRKWKIETGLQYMVSGYKIKDYFFGSRFMDIHSSSVKESYQHLLIPVQISYAFPVYDDIYFEPLIGAAAGFNMGLTNTNQYKDDKELQKMSKDVFNYRYNKFALWGIAGFRFQFDIDRKYAVVAGSTFQYMMSNFIKSTQLSFYTDQHNYAIMFSAGLKVKI